MGRKVSKNQFIYNKSKTLKRKTMKRKTLKRKTLKRKTLKRKTLKRKTLKRRTLNNKTLNNKTLKRRIINKNKLLGGMGMETDDIITLIETFNAHPDKSEQFKTTALTMADELMVGTQYDKASLLYNYVISIDRENERAIKGIETIKQNLTEIDEGIDEGIVPDIRIWNDKYSDPEKFNPKLEKISEYIITLTEEEKNKIFLELEKVANHADANPALKDAIDEYIQDKIVSQVNKDLEKYGDDNKKSIKYLFSLRRKGSLNELINKCIDYLLKLRFPPIPLPESFTSEGMRSLGVHIKEIIGISGSNETSLNGGGIISTIGGIFRFILTALKLINIINTDDTDDMEEFAELNSLSTPSASASPPLPSARASPPLSSASASPPLSSARASPPLSSARASPPLSSDIGMNPGMFSELLNDIESFLTHDYELGKGSFGITYKVEYNGGIYCMKKILQYSVKEIEDARHEFNANRRVYNLIRDKGIRIRIPTMKKIIVDPVKKLILLIQEFIEGDEIRFFDICGRGGGVKMTKDLTYHNLAIGLLECIKIFKENGVAHNDIHSKNIMVDNDGNGYLIDYGLCAYDIDSNDRLRKKYRLGITRTLWIGHPPCVVEFTDFNHDLLSVAITILLLYYRGVYDKYAGAESKCGSDDTDDSLAEAYRQVILDLKNGNSEPKDFVAKVIISILEKYLHVQKRCLGTHPGSLCAAPGGPRGRGITAEYIQSLIVILEDGFSRGYSCSLREQPVIHSSPPLHPSRPQQPRSQPRAPPPLRSPDQQRNVESEYVYVDEQGNDYPILLIRDMRHERRAMIQFTGESYEKLPEKLRQHDRILDEDGDEIESNVPLKNDKAIVNSDHIEKFMNK